MLRTEGGDVRARAVVVSAGVKYRRLGVPGIERLVGLGVFYGSAMTAAREMEGNDVVVVGGGNSAGQAAIHLARFAGSVTILVRRPDLESTMSAYLIGEIAYNPRITVQPCSEVVEVGGEGRLEWITVRDTTTGADDASRRARPLPAARRRAALRLAARLRRPRRARLRADGPRRAARALAWRPAPGQPRDDGARASSRRATSGPAR